MRPYTCDLCGHGASTAWPSCPGCGALGPLPPTPEPRASDSTWLQAIGWVLLIGTLVFTGPC